MAPFVESTPYTPKKRRVYADEKLLHAERLIHTGTLLYVCFGVKDLANTEFVVGRKVGH
jgi:hypothetical protein